MSSFWTKRQRFAVVQAMIEILAGEELLNEVRNVRVALAERLLVAEVVEDRDVRMLDVSGDLRFAQEALLRFVVLGRAGLDRDEPLHERVATFVDDAEAALSDPADDLVSAGLLEITHFRISSIPQRKL